jgi:hypothetical protein
MKLSELLAHITGPMLDDRAVLISGTNDQLFADATVVRYLNEAEKKLCRDAWVLEDFSPNNPTVTEIQLVEDTSLYPLHKSILHVKAARLDDTEVDLVRVGYDDNRLTPGWGHMDFDVWDINVSMQENPGRPQRYSVDMGTRTMRIRRKPDAAAALLKVLLNVVRMPLVALDVSLPDNTPEVPEEHHLELAQYAAGMCLANTADIDAELRSLGTRWVREFNERCEAAKRDRERRQQSAPQFRFGAWGRGSE